MINNFLFYLISFFWIISQTKSIFFSLYLWQLKEYHLGRFIDHFRTEKGKKIIFNKIRILKLFILLLFVFFALLRPIFFYFLLFFYLFETTKSISDLLKNKLIKPVFTKKIIFLTFVSFFFSLFYLFIFFQKDLQVLFWFLVFDIFNLGIFSAIVLIFQPLSAILRYREIKRAIKKREKFQNLLVIGITGSYGKTSTKEFLATILEEKFPSQVLKTKEHQNSEIGISKCILKELNENHKIFIVEMGAYNKGGISLLAKITKPKIAILTGINEQHLALFGSMENLISAEGGKELIECLPEDGLVIFNGENEILRKIYQETTLRKKIVGFYQKDFDLWASNIKVKKEVLFFQVFSKEGDFADFNLNLIGDQNIENILLAVCCAKNLGMDLKDISRACQKIQQEQTGIRLIKTKEGLNIVDSTYSANPTGVISHLKYLKLWEGEKVVIMPSLIELGAVSKEIHKKIGEKIGEVCNLAIIVTKDYFKEIKEGAIKSGMPKENIIFLEKPKDIVEKIKNFCKKGGVVLLEGRIPKEINQLLCQNQF